MVQYDQSREHRLLVLPALFDEANKLRRMTVEVMRRLDEAGIDSALPDLPGMNESLVDLGDQTLAAWREGASVAAKHFKATHVLALRGGTLFAPQHMPGWLYAPQKGAKQLRAMLRARTVAAREAGREEKLEDLQTSARRDGIELAGWQIGATMFAGLESAEIIVGSGHVSIDQEAVGGAGLWLRAEPDEDADQATSLAGIIAGSLEAAE